MTNKLLGKTPFPSLPQARLQFRHLSCPLQFPLPLLSLHVMLSPFGEVTGGTGQDQSTVISFLLLFVSYSFSQLCYGLIHRPQSLWGCPCASVGLPAGADPQRYLLWHGAPPSRSASPAVSPTTSPPTCLLLDLL